MLLTLASQKGGVGKTTTAVNLAATLALAGRTVLLVDFDPQGNASSGVGLPATDAPGLLSAAVPAPAEDALKLVRRTAFERLHLLPASGDLSNLELIHETQLRRLPQLESSFQRLAGAYDFVLIDCPPSLGGLPTLALSCSNRILIPVQCEYYAMEGLSQIIPVVEDVRKSNNPGLEVIGLLLTLFSEELELSRDVAHEVREYFPDSVFETVIPRDVELAEASSHGVPAFYYSALCRGAWSYVELAKEVLRNEKS